MRRTLVVAIVIAAVSAPAAFGGSETEGPSMAKDVTLKVKSTQFGRVLFAGNGRVLYAFTRDRRGGPSRCYGACARAWPVYFAGTRLRAGVGVKRSLIGTVRRRDGRRQITYNGWPLYYYAHEGPGEIKCQNVDQFGGLWLVVRPSGRLVR
jgi:predicted lipoprotein with Yx(FWY)xxD motif